MEHSEASYLENPESQTLEQHKLETTLEFEKIVASIDMDRLSSIVSDYYHKAGLQDRKVELLKPEIVFDSNMALGQFTPTQDRIYINYEKLLDDARDMNFDKEVLMHHIVFHEEGHKVAKTQCFARIETSYERIRVRNAFRMDDYASYEDGNMVHIEQLYNFFNEGVNEKFAREIVDRYMQGAGGSLKGKYEDYKSFGEAYGGHLYYDEQVDFVDAFCERIAEETGVGKDLVWQSLIREALAGDGFMDGELRTLISEMFGKDFLKRLSKLNNNEDLFNLLVATVLSG